MKSREKEGEHKNKVHTKGKLQIQFYNNKRKEELTPVSPAVQACSYSSMKVSSPLSYIKKIKITWKKIKT